MGYLHIDNLYKNQEVLLFHECYVLEKIHGTSAHVKWKNDQLYLFSGEQQKVFEQLFDTDKLIEKFKSLGYEDITFFGEAYGGKC